MVKLTSILSWNGYHNIPKKYIYRKMFKGVVYENIHKITPTVVYNYTKDWIYDENAPWTTMAQIKNDPSKYKRPVLVAPLLEWTFFRGDIVQVLVGKDAGKQGFVVGIVKQRNWVFVSGLNCKLIGFNPTNNPTNISYLLREMPLIVNKEVKLVDPSDKRPCEVCFRYNENGEKIRVSKRTGQIVPYSPYIDATEDYQKKSDYTPGEKDTDPKEFVKETFKPEVKTFEQDLMDRYGIKRPEKKSITYVY